MMPPRDANPDFLQNIAYPAEKTQSRPAAALKKVVDK
jgi:hypothetical protein